MQIQLKPGILALIFDCDGTLADTMPLHMIAWKKTFMRLGEPDPREFLYPLSGMNEKQIITLYNEKMQKNLNPDVVIQLKNQFFLSMKDQIKPIHPVTDIINKYRGRLPMSVVSGGSFAIVNLTLEKIALKEVFHSIITANDPFSPKPSPDGFLEAARRMQISPIHCQVFEDGEVGIIAAKAAGMHVTDLRQYL